MTKNFFITGTDTHVGKTSVSVALLQYFSQQGYSTVGLKPIASGASYQHGAWVNDDGLRLQQASSIKLPYALINPLVFEQPIAPHLAARDSGVMLSVESVMQSLASSLAIDADVRIIEGAGGLCVPLNAHETTLDLMKVLACPVILVVAMRLGCLNHALLTSHVLQQAQVPFLGWIANCVDPEMSHLTDNINTLRERLPGRCLGVIPYNHFTVESWDGFNNDASPDENVFSLPSLSVSCR